MDHLHEMSGAGRATMQVAHLRGAGRFFATGSTRQISATGRERFENGIEMFYDVVGPANHHAIAAFEPPDAAARADVSVIDFFAGEIFGAANVVDVIGITAVDDDVASFEKWSQLMQRIVDHSGGNHEPNGTGFRELFREFVER